MSGREVSESCIDAVILEMVSAYCTRFYANKHELAARRIEAIGYQVGHQLTERYTVKHPGFSNHLDAIKFICKDFWWELFKKNVDNLRTNRRGTFVLQDNQFHWLKRMMLDSSMKQDSSKTMEDDETMNPITMHLYFPCGIIRGALSNLGIQCAVSSDISNLPTCSFVVRIKP